MSIWDAQFFTQDEFDFCKDISTRQLQEDLRVGGKHKFHHNGYTTEQAHLDGLMADWAVHKLYDLKFDPPVNRDGKGDGGIDFVLHGVPGQVKHILKPYHALFFRPGSTDFHADVAVLVLKVDDLSYQPLGWITKEKFNKLAVKDDFGKGPQYEIRKVAQKHLNPMNTLEEYCLEGKKV